MFGSPSPVGQMRTEVAEPDAHRRTRQRAYRLHDQPLAAEPQAEQHRRTDQGKLHISDPGFAIDAGKHLAFADPDGDVRVGAGELSIGKHAPHPVDGACGDPALRLRQHRRDQRSGQRTADPALQIGVPGDAFAIHHDGYRSGTLADGLGQASDPVQIDGCGDQASDGAVRTSDGHGGHDRRLVLQASDQVVAEHELAGPHGVVKIVTIRQAQADRVGKRRADHPPVGIDR
jgi:hypothetical protein